MPWHSIRTYTCVHVVRQICLKIPSNLLHVELTRTWVDKYDFSNRYGQSLHVDELQIWITVIKWQENHLNMSLKGQMTARIFQIFTVQL